MAEPIAAPFWGVTLILGVVVGFFIAAAFWAAYDSYTTAQKIRKDRELIFLSRLIRSIVTEELNRSALEEQKTE